MAAAKFLGFLPYPLLEGEGKRTKETTEIEDCSLTTAIAEGGYILLI